MKHALKLSLLLLLSTANITVYAQMPATGLVAHWPLNGNANDVSGNGHHGTINNLTSVAGKLGIPNTGYLFNTANSYITVPYGSDLNVTKFSICAVIKPTAFYSGVCEGNFILCRNQGEFTPGQYYLEIFDNPYNACSVYDTNLMVFGGGVTPNGPPVSQWQSASKLHTQNWYCVVLTYDSAVAKIYVNGVLACTATPVTFTTGSSTSGINIGKHLAGGSTYPYNFTGVMDDVALYSRALTSTEVQDYCNAVAPPDTTAYISQPLNNTSFCLRDTFHLTYQVNLPFNSGNVFTAQLSDAAGSFASPVAIGSVTSNTAGTIVCTIPNGTNAGTAYRVRIVSSSPSKISADNGIDLMVKPMPANINASNNSPICAGNTLALTGSTTSTGVVFLWTGPNSFTSTAQNPNIANAQTNAAGNYILKYTLSGCSLYDTTTAVINITPATPNAFSNSPVCTGSTLNLTATTVSGATYLWTGPNGFSSTTQNPSFTVLNTSSAGKYYVQADNNGCASPKDSVTIVVNQGPSVNIYPSPKDSICVGSKVTFVAIPNSAGSNPQYKWYLNNVLIPGAINVSYGSTGINDGDIIYCVLSAAGICSSVTADTSNKITMTVMPWLTPSVTISANPATPLSPNQLVTFTATATNGGNNPKFQWKRNGTDIVGATSFTWGTFQLSDNDSISVVLTSSYLCPQPIEATSNAIKVQILTGIDDIEDKNNINLYPNPNNGKFTVKGNLAYPGEIHVEVVSSLGQLVYHTTRTVRTGTINEQLDIQNLSDGVYILRIKADNEIKTLHFAVSR